MIAIITNPLQYHIGELISVVGILLLYVYNIIKIYRFWHSIIYFILFLSAKIAVNFTLKPILLSNYFAESFVTMVIIMFILNISKMEILTYLKEIQKEKILIRIGRNASAWLHHFKFAAEKDYVKDIFDAVKLKDFNEITNSLNSLNDSLNKKDFLRDNLLKGIMSEASYIKKNYMNVNIHKVIDSILDIYGLDKKIFGTIYFSKNYCMQEIYVAAIYEEIYLLFQNLIANSIDSMIETKHKEHVLYIDTKKALTEQIVIISDTGQGFKKEFTDSNSKILMENVITTKKDGTGLGLNYVRNILTLYNGKIEYFNLPDGGVKAIIKLPYWSEKNGK